MAALAAFSAHLEVVRGDRVRRGERLFALVIAICPTFACSGGTKYIGANPDGASIECATPTAPPAVLGLDSFYEKYLDAHGIPITSSASVADQALERACDITNHVLEKRDDIHAELVRNGLYVVIIAQSEVMTDIPEYFDIYDVAPNFDWDNDGRGTGPFVGHPLASAGEENLLCLSEDLFGGEALLVFSLAHGLRSLGLLDLVPEFDDRLRAAYDAAMAAGLFADTHAATSHPQYWAEGVQDWFDANREVIPGPDGVHNHINTRVELEAYDPELAALIAEYAADDDWRPPCFGN